MRHPAIIGKPACAGEALRTQRERWLPNPSLQRRSRTGRHSQKGCTTTEGNLRQYMLRKTAGGAGTATEENPKRLYNRIPCAEQDERRSHQNMLKAKYENLRCSKDTANPTDKRTPHPHRITMHPHWKHHTTLALLGVRLAAKRSQSQPQQVMP